MADEAKVQAQARVFMVLEGGDVLQKLSMDEFEEVPSLRYTRR